MQDIVQGKVWKFGDNVDTDVIVPSIYMNVPVDEMKKHVLERLRPEFTRDACPGDVIVAGANFGCGSSREQAPVAIKALGIAAVVAESFSRIFFRNAIAIGLPAITCPQVSAAFQEGDIMNLDVGAATVTNMSTHQTLIAQPLPKEMLDVLMKGGIIPMLKE